MPIVEISRYLLQITTFGTVNLFRCNFDIAERVDSRLLKIVI